MLSPLEGQTSIRTLLSSTWKVLLASPYPSSLLSIFQNKTNLCNKCKLQSFFNYNTKSGATKGAYYQVNPTLLTNAKSNIVTTLKTIEPYVLKALIKEDLRRHPMSKISEIASRVPDVEIKEIRKLVYSMVGTEIAKKGARVDCRYYLI